MSETDIPAEATEDVADVVTATGKFRIYLGAAAGVGKTFAKLEEGKRRHDRGRDVVVGFVESSRPRSHDRGDPRPRGGPGEEGRIPGFDL